MPSLIIKQGDKTSLSRNFTANEFYSKSSDAPASHSFPSELVEAAQLLRDSYGVPFRVTSTVRTPSHEYRLCIHKGEDYARAMMVSSQHVKRRAMDIQPTSNTAAVMSDLQFDIIDRGFMFKKLRALGVTGFGLYDTFVHLDVRKEAGKQKDEFGTYAFWNNMKGAPKKTKPSSTTKTKKAPASVPLPSGH